MKKVIYSLFVLLLASCANRVTPTGGEKDVEAPKLLVTIPENKSIHFNSKEIHLHFDENITLNDLQGQFFVSPLMSKLPEVKSNKREVIITLPDDLALNTTYTLNFGKSIVDVHEANPLDNFQYVFSTGDFLDSLKVEGNVAEASTAVALKSITVLVYRKSIDTKEDSIVFRKRPDYFAKSNEKGEFKIDNMAAGEYRLYAVDDKNSNYVCDSSGEEPLAFMDSTIVLPGDEHPILRLSNLEPAAPRFLKALRLDRYSAMISFNKRIDSLVLKNLEGTSWMGLKYSLANRDTFYFYSPDTLSDSLSLLMYDGDKLIDTLLQNLMPPAGVVGTKTRLRINPRQSPASFGPSTAFVFNANHPLQLKLDSAEVVEDSSKAIRLPLQMIDPTTGFFKIDYPWQNGKKYKLTIFPGAIRDIYAITNDTLKLDFLVPTEENMAMLSIKTQNLDSDKNYLLQILSEKFELIREMEINKDSTYTFSYLNTVPIKLRIIEDANRDHRYTYSHFAQKRQPEKVFIYPEPITLRANWELEVVFVAPQ
ncbi:MAG: Ig-like domain-containing protein [Bacteroidetes bacterium]|nr:Ig-like domain-containing protein [Bacteroidota bacterium]